MDIVNYGRGSTQLTGPIIDGTYVRQSFVADGNHLSEVSLLFSTYKRKNPGVFYAEIVDQFDKVIVTDYVESPKLEDNKRHTFKLECDLCVGRNYEFRIRTMHCRSGNAPTLHYGVLKRGGYLFVGARLVRYGELVCDFIYEKTASVVEVKESIAKESIIRDANSPDVIREFLVEDNPMVSIIIPTKDNFELISRCIQSITDVVECEYEVIIGDTGSTDGRVLGMYESLPPNFRVVQNLDYHFSRVNNELARQANGGHLLFLNNDVSFDQDIVSAMLKYSLCFGVGAVGVRLMKPRGVIDHDGQLLWDESGVSEPNHDNINKTLDMVDSLDLVTQGVTAACMMTRKAIFDRMGGFDEDYEDVYQDCDYCLKLGNQNFKCVTVKECNALHVGSATRGPTTAQRASVKRDRTKYMDKWKGRFTAPHRPLLSMITCANNPDLYDGMVKSLPEGEKGMVEWLPVRNHGNLFTVTEALNMGKIVAQGQYLSYAHQDIRFCDNWLKHIRLALKAVPDDAGIIGFEGLRAGGTPYTCRSVRVDKPVKVQTLDELCLITKRRELEFDERFLFHYYGADICMQALKQGLHNYLVGAVVEHLSGGADNILQDIQAFKMEAEHFRQKWDDDIWTTTTKFLKGKIDYMILAKILNEGNNE